MRVVATLVTLAALAPAQQRKPERAIERPVEIGLNELVLYLAPESRLIGFLEVDLDSYRFCHFLAKAVIRIDRYTFWR